MQIPWGFSFHWTIPTEAIAEWLDRMNWNRRHKEDAVPPPKDDDPK